MNGQFGVNKPGNKGNKDGSIEIGAMQAEMQEMLNDSEMMEAMKMLTQMSPEEMKETLQELIETSGDDPETKMALERAMEEIAEMDMEEVQDALAALMEEEQIAHAIHDTMEMLGNADDATWEEIISKKDVILQAVIESGQLSQDDIDRYQNDSDAWENELKFIWKELKSQAAAATKIV